MNTGTNSEWEQSEQRAARTAIRMGTRTSRWPDITGNQRAPTIDETWLSVSTAMADGECFSFSRLSLSALGSRLSRHDTTGKASNN